MFSKGISCRNYKACAESVPEAFGISASSVSRRFIKATAKKLKQFQERPLDDYGFVTLFIDGKSFADEEIVIAPGVTMDGQKIPLGFVESATENERICRQLIQDLIRRGLCYDQGLLVVLDGSKGLRSAVTKALKGYVRVHRCQWHKRENVVSDVEECGRHPSVFLGRVVPASDLPSELAGHAVEGFDAVGGSEASFQEWEHTQPVEGQGFLQAFLEARYGRLIHQLQFGFK